MKYILATDSFKGCMSSQEVEDEIADVLNAKGIETVCLPMSDGGDGMLSAFTAAMGGTLEPVYIHDLMMRRTDAHYGVTPDGTAIVEVAQACGLSLIKEEERNPMRATSYGVGELLARAIKRGCRKFVIGLGGTATSDAGIGMIKALVDIFARGKNFDEALKTELGKCRFTLACDVDNPLCGENGAAHVYGPQKGATPEMVDQLDRRSSCSPRSRRCTSTSTEAQNLARELPADWVMPSCSISEPRESRAPTCCSTSSASTRR